MFSVTRTHTHVSKCVSVGLLGRAITVMDGPCVGGPYYLLCERVCVTGPGGHTPAARPEVPGEPRRTAGRIDLASRSAGCRNESSNS